MVSRTVMNTPIKIDSPIFNNFLNRYRNALPQLHRREENRGNLLFCSTTATLYGVRSIHPTCYGMRKPPFLGRVFEKMGNKKDGSAPILHHYQSLFFSYPSLTNKSPATSFSNLLWSSVKCCFQPPVFPERKV